MSASSRGKGGHRAWCADRLSEVRTLEVAGDAFERDEEERLVLLQRPADRAPLFAVEIFEARAVRQVARQLLDPLEVEEAAGQRVRPRLGDDVDDPAGGAAELGGGAGGNDLEFLDASSVMSTAARWPPACSPKKPLL